jgi:hypothetical protein
MWLLDNIRRTGLGSESYSSSTAGTLVDNEARTENGMGQRSSGGAAVLIALLFLGKLVLPQIGRTGGS